MDLSIFPKSYNGFLAWIKHKAWLCLLFMYQLLEHTFVNALFIYLVTSIIDIFLFLGKSKQIKRK